MDSEHLCCAIADKKHQCGVDTKRAWLKDRMSEAHTFRKLDEKGKVFIEYAPLEPAWYPFTEKTIFTFIACGCLARLRAKGMQKNCSSTA